MSIQLVDAVDAMLNAGQSVLPQEYGGSYIGAATYAQLRAYTGDETRMPLYDGYVAIRRGTAADNGGTVWKDALNRSWERQYSGPVSPTWWGASGDGGVTDNTAAVNAAILECAIAGGGTVAFDQAKSSYYLIAGKILLPSNVTLDLNGQILRGTSATAGTMFETATLEAGALVSNIGSAPESELVFYAKIKNGQIQNVGQGLNFYNFTIGCSLEDLHFENVKQAWKMSRCFYAKYEHITARGGSVAGTPTYWFYDNTNAVNINRVTGTTEFPFLFEKDTNAVVMTSCTTEGGSKGIKFIGNVNGFTLDGHYFENMPQSVNGTALDFSEAGVCYMNFKSNYFNYIDTVLDDGGESGTCTLFGTWDESNQIFNAGAVLDGNTYRGLMKVAGPRNHIRYNLREITGLAQLEIPANWQCSELTDAVVYNAYGGDATNDIRAKSAFRGAGVIPVNRGGDIGAGYPNRVPFAMHYALTPGSPSITVVVDTQIKWQPDMLFAKFALRIADANSSYFVYGDIYGDQVKQLDATGKSVTINANSISNLQLRIATFSHPAGTYSCTGTVQICG